MTTVAALYVETDGPYSGLDGVDVWDEARDARMYSGPHPVMAHPPCNRWSVIASINQAMGRLKVGDDGGCFASALEAVREFGGVLEHPAKTFAWKHHGLLKPCSGGGWTRSLFDPGWVCEVDQCHYGHTANKMTWLYVIGVNPESFIWKRSPNAIHRISNLNYKGVGHHLKTGGREASTMSPSAISCCRWLDRFADV